MRRHAPSLPEAQALPLPPCPPLRSREDVEAYAALCLEALGLKGWLFGWDKAKRRLGCCWQQRRRITLSRYFVDFYLQKEPAQVRRTLLHELAHALAWKHYGDRLHGEVWHYFCACLGIADERACFRGEPFAPAEEAPASGAYVLCHDETGEIFLRYRRRPRRSARRLKYCYIPSRKKETLGHLQIRRLP